MLKFFLHLLLLTGFLSSQAQDVSYYAGAKAMALGSAGVVFSDAQASVNNQAALAGLHQYSFQLSATRRFSMAGLNEVSFCGALPPGKKVNGTFGLGINYFGNSNFNRSKITLGYGMKLGKTVQAGVGFDYLETVINGYGNRNNIAAEMGLLAQVNKSLTLGVHVFNPVNFKKKSVMENQVPTLFNLGLLYAVSKRVWLNAETQKDFTHPFIFKSGVEYLINNLVFLRGGYSTNPGLLSAGVGLQAKNFNFDFSFNYHSVLGVSPLIGIGYTPQSTKSYSR